MKLSMTQFQRHIPLVALTSLMMSPGVALAQQSGSITGALRNALCLVMGTQSPLVMFLAGVAVVVFFAVLAINEGNQMVSWAAKIMIGVGGLIGAGQILNMLFGVQMVSGCGAINI